ncbi:MAG: hypothetical protein P1U56_25860 [Saprospiraceae bacterium]|nr:hypothetical protein [Saprospiraceae bacterium]
MTDQIIDGGNNSKVNTAFWVIGVVALLWNLMGLGSFVTFATLSEDAMELMSEAQKEEYQSTPIWLTIAFGLATICGTLGAIALLMKKKWAIMLFLVSFIAVIVQFAGGVIGSNSVKENGMTALILPLIVIIVAGLLWYYAKKCDEKGWLS